MATMEGMEAPVRSLVALAEDIEMTIGKSQDVLGVKAELVKDPQRDTQGLLGELGHLFDILGRMQGRANVVLEGVAKARKITIGSADKPV